MHGATVWFTGLSGSGKSTVASAVAEQLTARGVPTTCSTATTCVTGSTATSASPPTSRVENVRRVAEVARLFADAGVHALVPVISPYRAGREQARALHEAAGLAFVEVYVATSLDVCERATRRVSTPRRARASCRG